MNSWYECWINTGSFQIRMPNTVPVEAGNLCCCGLDFSCESIGKQPVSLENVEKGSVENIDAHECKLSI